MSLRANQPGVAGWPKVISVIGQYGRLGNQLWTNANVLAYCLSNGVRFSLGAVDRAGLFLGRDALDDRHRSLCVRRSFLSANLLRLLYKANVRLKVLPWLHLGERSCLRLDDHRQALKALALERIVFLTGFYFHAPRSMEENGAMLRDYFRPVDRYWSRVGTLVAAAREGNRPVVGVHLRRGDYRTYCGGIMYYDDNEMREVLGSLAKEFVGARVRFLICSDEPVDPEAFPGLDVIISNEEPVVDMYALARCDYIIGPNSSFSHWASFYGEVPLHVLDYKAANAREAGSGVIRPSLRADFDVFGPDDFARYAVRHVSLDEALSAHGCE